MNNIPEGSIVGPKDMDRSKSLTVLKTKEDPSQEWVGLKDNNFIRESSRHSSIYN
jgi:hypothetical protein